MFTQIIMAAALCGQANPDAVASPEKQKALLAAIQAKAVARPKPWAVDRRDSAAASVPKVFAAKRDPLPAQESPDAARIRGPEAPTVRYDKFEDRTFIRMSVTDFEREDEDYSVILLTNHVGKGPHRFAGGDSCSLFISRYEQGWKFLTYHDIKMMVGDDRVPHSNDRYSSKMDGTVCIERVSTRIRLGTLKEFVAMGDLEVKIGIEEPLVIGATARAAIRRYVDFLERGCPSSEARIESPN